MDKVSAIGLTPPRSDVSSPTARGVNKPTASILAVRGITVTFQRCSNDESRFGWRAASYDATEAAIFCGKFFMAFGYPVSYGCPTVGCCSAISRTSAERPSNDKRGNLMQWMIRATLVLVAASWLGSEAEACHRCCSTTQCRPQCRPVCHRCRRCCCCCTTGATTGTAAATTSSAAVATAAATGTVRADGWATVTPPKFAPGGNNQVNNGLNPNPQVSRSDATSNEIWKNLNDIVANTKGLREKITPNLVAQLDQHK